MNNNFVITIMDNPKSIAAAERCIESGKKTGGMNIEMFPAITPKDDLTGILTKEGIDKRGFIERYSRTPNCIAAFLSHYTLWKQCAESYKTFFIFEHDAVIVNNINSQLQPTVAMNLGSPSYGKYNMPRIGEGPLTSKAYFPGAHAYCVSPKGAEQLVYEAKRNARPTDVFLNIHTFPGLQEKYPWPVECQDSFTTIQNETGCLAKHNYNEQYEII